MIRVALMIIVAAAFSHAAAAAPADEGMTLVPGGRYVPFVLTPRKGAAPEAKYSRTPVDVSAFTLDVSPVTNRDFLRFVRANPEWRKSRVRPLFADGRYLEDWRGDLRPAAARSPVTHISWFAARAYCEWLGKTLPTTDQWEYALHDEGRDQEAVRAKILEWYGQPSRRTLPAAGAGAPNGFGVRDLAGLVWEWTDDFGSFLAGDELREAGSKDTGLFCGGGSLGTLDSTDYAAFMRYSFRSSLKASYTTGNLGFRCAKEIAP